MCSQAPSGYYSGHGDVSYRFDRYERVGERWVWKGFQMHRGAIAEELGKQVAVTLYRKKEAP